MHVRTLGRAELSANGTRLGPEAKVAFPLLLHLVLERDRWVSRVQLQEMLFPEQDHQHARHSLRQSVYVLRKEGFPIEGSGPAVQIPGTIVVDDYSTLLTPQLEGERELGDLMGGWLAGFEPTISKPYSHWFEGKRSEIALRMRSSLLAELAVHKRNARWAQCERTCRAILTLDPLNEEATLGLAEALALTGAKVQAIKILERYQEEMPTADLQLSAKILRRRIGEQQQPAPFAQPPGIVGRSAELQTLSDLFKRSQTGANLAAVVCGDPGIGKTRLLSTFADTVRLSGSTVLLHTCQPHDSRRPLGAFADVVPQLRRLPGSLGCSPGAFELLERVVQFPDPHSPRSAAGSAHQEELSAHVSSAISDLMDAVTVEAPLLLIIDDAHCLDALSSQVLKDLVSERKERRMLVVVSVRPDASRIPFPSAPGITLSSLSRKDSMSLLAAAISGPIDPAFANWAIDASAGNPLYLLSLAQQSEPGIRQVPMELRAMLSSRMQSTSEPSRKVLSACAILGKNATFARLEKLLDISRSSLLDTLSELDTAGLLNSTMHHVAAAHPLMVEIASASVPPVARRYLHYSAAQLIEADAVSSRSASLLWDAAIHWEEAGSPKQALGLFLRCAEQSLSIGETAEAVAMIKRAGLLAVTPDERRRYCEISIGIARAAIDSGLLQTTCRELLSLEHLQASVAQEASLGLLEAEFLSCSYSEETTSALAKIITASDIAAPLHTRAVTLLLMSLANIGGDPDRARGAYQTLSPLEPSSSLDRKWAEVIYQSSFGDPLKTKEVAEDILGMWRADRTKVPFRAVTHCGSALFRAGCVSTALEALADVFAAAIGLGLPTVAFRAACEAGLLRLGADDLDGARDWSDRARSHCESDARAPHSNWLYLNFLIAIIDGNTNLARRCLERLSAEVRMSGERSDIIMAIMRTRLDAMMLKEYGGPPATITRSFEEQANRSDMDLPAVLLVEACQIAHQNDRARFLASVAISKRRDVNRPPARLIAAAALA